METTRDKQVSFESTEKGLKWNDRGSWVEFRTMERPDGSRYEQKRKVSYWGALRDASPWENIGGGS
jgi:hypothetical protein